MTLTSHSISGYTYDRSGLGCAHDYLLPRLSRILGELRLSDKRVFDLGCGSGGVAAWLGEQGYQVTGVDPSTTGIEVAKEAVPQANLQVGSCYDPLAAQYGQFPLVVSLEVVEHVYAPRDFARAVYDLLLPGGIALISTPYHGYWKNLALSLFNRMDSHFTALWDHGHIKFWSIRTLGQLMTEAKLLVRAVHRIGRVPALAKSMLLVCQRS